MTYSYSEPLIYGQQPNNMYYDNMSNNKSYAAPAAITGGILGGGIGAIAGCCKKTKPYKNGEVTDTFTKSVYEKYIETAADTGKEAYKGGLNILNNIDNVKNVEELKNLFSENSQAAEEICTEMKQTPEEFLNHITDKNLSKNKKIIKEKINAGNNTRYRNMKNKIEACWDKDKKQFVKNEHVTEDIFNTIKKTAGKINGKTVAKFAAIGAVVTGTLSFIAAKLFIK